MTIISTTRNLNRKKGGDGNKHSSSGSNKNGSGAGNHSPGAHGDPSNPRFKQGKRPRKDPKNYTGIFKSYVQFSMKVEAVTVSDWFNGLIICVILLAGLLVGIQTYGCSEVDAKTVKYVCYTSLYENPYITFIDNVILTIFTTECFLKMLSEGMEPWRYFTGPEKAWNNFDFTIVLLCMPFIPIGGDEGGNSVALLRLLRLLRVMKLVKKIPQLQMIIQGLFSGMKSIGYIGLLLFMVFYLYAILGMTLFADNDPWHYGDLFTAFNTLFRMMTLEDWTDVMYVNLYGCDSSHLGERFDSGFYTNSNISYMRDATNVTLFDCVPGMAPNQWLSVLYFFSFIVISSLVALSLILGAITMGMADAMDEMKALQQEKNRQKKLAAAEKRMRKYRETKTQVFSPNSSKTRKRLPPPLRISSKHRIACVTVPQMRPPIGGNQDSASIPKTCLASSSMQLDVVADSGEVAANRSVSSENQKVIEGPPSFRTSSRKNASPMIQTSASEGMDEGEMATRDEIALIDGRASPTAHEQIQEIKRQDSEQRASCMQRCGFEEGDSSTDLLRVVLLAAWNGEKVSFKEVSAAFAVSNDTHTGMFHALAKFMRQIRDSSYFINFVTAVILGAGVVVGVEVEYDTELVVANKVILGVFIVEIIVKTLAEYLMPLRYFFHHGAVDKWNLFDFVVVAGSLIPMGSATSIVTMLRLLRLLRVLKLVKAFPQLQVIVEALVNGVKSIYYIGIIMFMFFYVFGILGMILFRDNDPWHFGTLHDTLITLFRMATLEDWTDVMYINMHGCLHYGYSDFPELCMEASSADPHDVLSRVAALLYSWVIVIFGGLILVPLFIGVVVSSMEEAVAAQKESQAVEREVASMADKGDIPFETIELYCKVFEMLDVDASGAVDMDELLLGLTLVGVQVSELELELLMAEALEGAVDTGELSKPRFIRFMQIAKEKRLKRERIRAARIRPASKNSAKVKPEFDAMETPTKEAINPGRREGARR